MQVNDKLQQSDPNLHEKKSLNPLRVKMNMSLFKMKIFVALMIALKTFKY